MRRFSWLAFGMALHAGSAFAGGVDPAAARAQLQQGYALKQQGHCEEALPYFVESIRMDRQPKALLNLADCEEKLHRLSAAQSHWVEARDVARELGLASYEKAAVERLAALEKTIPKLVVKVALDAPRDTVVTRDGVELSQVSLNTPLPIDPGKHSVVARTTTIERQYDVALAEGETKELEVTPVGGTSKVATSPPPSSSSLPSPAKPLDSRESTVEPSAPAAKGDVAESSGSSAQRTVGFVTAGVGVVGLAVGTVFAIQFASKNADVDAACSPAHPCPAGDAGQQIYAGTVDEAKSARTTSIVGFAAGGALLGAGLLLILTAPHPTSTSGLRLVPVVGSESVGWVARGAW